MNGLHNSSHLIADSSAYFCNLSCSWLFSFISSRYSCFMFSVFINLLLGILHLWSNLLSCHHFGIGSICKFLVWEIVNIIFLTFVFNILRNFNYMQISPYAVLKHVVDYNQVQIRFNTFEKLLIILIENLDMKY